MAVITQTYDIDLKATGWYPVVEMSQYDTGSRTVVLTVYDGRDLVPLDGCVARVDGRRSDGVEFTASCTIGANSTVSFTATQEMTRAAGKHVAELVIIDAAGNPIGTQNFVIDVEAAPMLRDAAASADDRTLYDQYTSSVESKFASLSDTLTTKADALNRTVEDISGLIGTGSKAVEILNTTLDVHTVLSNFTGTAYARATYDPVTALVTCRVGTVNALTRASGTGNFYFELGTLGGEYLPDESLYRFVDLGGRHVYRFANDAAGFSCGISKETAGGHNAGAIGFTLTVNADAWKVIHPDWTVSWYARGGKYIGVTPVGTGGNTVTVGKVTTGDAGTEASVSNSGTARDVVLDFTIPRGADGSGYTLPAATASTLGGIKVGSNLTVTDDGTLSATGGASDLSTLNPVVIGKDASGSYVSSVIIGPNAYADGDESTAVGNSANADGMYSTALGTITHAPGFGSVAIGASASAEAQNSVAIGRYAKATEANTVSVGGGEAYNTQSRRIVNVADPTSPQDAATKAYVDALEAKVTALTERVAALESK